MYQGFLEARTKHAEALLSKSAFLLVEPQPCNAQKYCKGWTSKHETARRAHRGQGQHQKPVRKMQMHFLPHCSSEETQRIGHTWPGPSSTVKRHYLNQGKTGGQGRTQHPGRGARRQQGGCSSGMTPHSTAPHHRALGRTTSPRCTQAASAPACPGTSPAEATRPVPALTKTMLKKAERAESRSTGQTHEYEVHPRSQGLGELNPRVPPTMMPGSRGPSLLLHRDRDVATGAPPVCRGEIQQQEAEVGQTQAGGEGRFLTVRLTAANPPGPGI